MSLWVSGQDLVLSISDSVLKKWEEHRQFAPMATEACGVLIGGYDTELDYFLIKDVTTPMASDKRSRRSFLMKDKGHQEVVDQIFVDSSGKYVYFGTWHTHPENCPIPSGVDTCDWKACINRNKGRQLFFVIVGTKETKVFVEIKSKFVALERFNGDAA